jgi:DNA ligase 1
MNIVRQWPTLYKKNSNGSFQQWTISVVSELDPDTYVEAPAIVKEFGQVGGKLQTSDLDFIQGKNINRANETTNLQQAQLEAEAQWTKKKTGGKGYVESMDDAAAGKKDVLVTGGADPMLAHSFAKQGHKIVYPAYAQPKLDGIRCVAVIEDGKCTLWTRTRKPIVSMPHIVEAIEALDTGDLILDGELYNHDYKDKFEEIVSLVRPEYVKDGANVVQYHIFDAIVPEMYSLRLIHLRKYVGSKIPDGSPLCLVETVLVEDEDDLMDAFAHFRSLGYEGAIARNAISMYIGKRSYDLQKIKEFDDAEFRIFDVVEGRGKMAGKAIFTCITESGQQFNAKMEGSLDNLSSIWDSRLDHIGHMLTVRYQGLTNGGVPRFPIGVSIRDYE